MKQWELTWQEKKKKKERSEFENWCDKKKGDELKGIRVRRKKGRSEFENWSDKKKGDETITRVTIGRMKRQWEK